MSELPFYLKHKNTENIPEVSYFRIYICRMRRTFLLHVENGKCKNSHFYEIVIFHIAMYFASVLFHYHTIVVRFFILGIVFNSVEISLQSDLLSTGSLEGIFLH